MTNAEDMAALAEMPSDVLPLVALLMRQNARDAAWGYQAAYTGEHHDRLRYQAELILVRQQVLDLISGPWMPTTDAIRVALEPDHTDIDELAMWLENRSGVAPVKRRGGGAP